MEFARIDNEFYCGIDLHARNMFVCVMNRVEEILFHRNMRNDFSLLLDALRLWQKYSNTPDKEGKESK